MEPPEESKVSEEKLETQEYGADSLAIIFSSGKSIASILIAMLVDKGLLKYNEPIATYWPEFAKNGKDKITVADLMRHEAGLQKFKIQIEAHWLETSNIKKNMIGEIIENEEIEYPIHQDYKNVKRSYHA